MPRPRVWLRLLLALLVVLPALAAEARVRLRVGYFDLPPHVQAGGAHPSGFAPVYFERIAARMGVRVEYLQLPLPRLLQMLERNELDAALILAKSPQRAGRLVYPAQPFFLTRPLIVVRQDGGILALAQLRSERHWLVGVHLGGYQAPFVEQLAGTPVQLSGTAVTERALRMLLAGRLDAFFSPDEYVVGQALHDKLLAQQLRVLAVPGEALPLYSVFSPRAASRHLAAYERALREQQAEQRYEALLAESLARP